MKLLKKINKKESGQALIIALILMLVGALIITPLLGYMGTGLMVGQVFEEKMAELYAADAGVEDAIYNIITPGAPRYDDLQGLDEGVSLAPPYQLTDINGMPVTITVTKLSLMQGLLSEDEINLNAPHEDWVAFGEPQVNPYPGEGYVEYECTVSFHYDGTGKRSLETVGAFFSPLPGDEDVIKDLCWYEETGVITFDNLQPDSPETKIVPGGFAFIWRWEHNQGPEFDKNNRDGAFNFKFRIYDLGWEYKLYFVWSTFKEQDISYVTNAPDLYKWLIETEAGDTEVRSVVFEETDGLNILTWEISLQ